MECDSALQQAIYDILRIQIESGTYCHMDKLPAIEEAAGYFFVAVDTVRAVYLRLRQAGYICLSKNVGARVIVQYDPAQMTPFLQTYFASRKDALIDLSTALGPLFTHAQCIGLKNASSETLLRMECLSKTHGKPQPPYAIWQCLEQKFAGLGNKLIIRLARQVYLFLYAPFFSINGSGQYWEHAESYVCDIIGFCRQNAWQKLDEKVNGAHDTLSAAVRQFLQEKITMQSVQSVPFRWDAYRKASQLCYSLATEILVDINRGIYPAGSYLPSAAQLSEKKGVSVSTVRRTVSLLGSIGAVKSSRPRGACVLPFDESLKNCDLTQTVIQRQLLGMLESLQIFALTCREVTERTLSALDLDSRCQWIQELEKIKGFQHFEVIGYCILELLAKWAPYQAIRVVYSELLPLLFWGYPLRGIKGGQGMVNAAYAPYIDKLIGYLETGNILRFSAKLEAFMLWELREKAECLAGLRIPGADGVLIPEGR